MATLYYSGESFAAEDCAVYAREKDEYGGQEIVAKFMLDPSELTQDLVDALFDAEGHWFGVKVSGLRYKFKAQHSSVVASDETPEAPMVQQAGQEVETDMIQVALIFQKEDSTVELA